MSGKGNEMSEGPAGGGGADAPASTSATSLFDLRNVIALLFGVYGAVLVVVGIVSGDDPQNLAKTGGSNLNLDTGIAMLVLGALFVGWVLLRPLRLPTPEEMAAQDDHPPGH